VGAVGALLLAATISTDRGYLPLVPGLVLLSAGQGVVYTVMFAVASTGVPARDHGIASGLVSTGQQVGNAVGLAALVALVGTGSDGLTGDALRVSTSDGVRTALFAIAAGIALSVLLAFGFRRRPTSA
ncbi:MAG: MFS transporter, partial [Pseudonocardia sp.]